MDVDGGGRRNEMRRVWGGWKKRNEMLGFRVCLRFGILIFF